MSNETHNVVETEFMMTLFSVTILLISTLHLHGTQEPFNTLTPEKVSQIFPLTIPETWFPLCRAILFPH